MNRKEFDEFLDDRIDDWHDGRTIIPKLWDYLRMTESEYNTWTRDNVLPYNMRSRWGLKEE